MAGWWRTNVIEPIHSFRVPLPRAGRNIMTLVYIGAPCVCGYYMMEWTNRKALENLPAIKNAHQSQVGKIHTEYQKNQLEIMLNEHKPPPATN
jgi:hypothetical protein